MSHKAGAILNHFEEGGMGGYNVSAQVASLAKKLVLAPLVDITEFTSQRGLLACLVNGAPLASEFRKIYQHTLTP